MGRVTDAIEATKEGNILKIIQKQASRSADSPAPAGKVSVAEAMQATADGTIIELTRASAAQRAASRPSPDPARMQRGRDLYNQLHKEGK